MGRVEDDRFGFRVDGLPMVALDDLYALFERGGEDVRGQPPRPAHHPSSAS